MNSNISTKLDGTIANVGTLKRGQGHGREGDRVRESFWVPMERIEGSIYAENHREASSMLRRSCIPPSSVCDRESGWSGY
jgi:hypothetical protein